MNIEVFDFLPSHAVLRAISHKLDSSVILSFTQGMDVVTLYLPPEMEACAAMIVGAFNAHRSGESVREGVGKMTAAHAHVADAIRTVNAINEQSDDIIRQRIEGFGVEAVS